MPEKIGKYHIVERIARGGMGVVYKAHDPILDRPVALKVIAPDVEVTDELRARFFREAQACARLSHPNIITIYDMGEHQGALFIVMELLDGAELRQLIAQRTPLALEDKLAVMLQVCDGLAYAHGKGVVHRDIKPANILLQRDGQVKILDFGIAQMATTERDLTRTGLIMGTLRYIAPEQIRGRADARSDMFSVGAVFYEFLSFRPAFTGDDPIHLLEQLRADEPAALQELDPTIPPDVAAIVARAMRKDPAQRFPDLRAMRAELEAVQRRLAEETQSIQARIRGQRDQVRELEAALAMRIRGPGDAQAGPTGLDRGALIELRGLERDLASRIEALTAKVAQADALAPALQRATELMAEGQCVEAALELEAIVAAMPEHQAAVQSLAQARQEAEAQRWAQLAARLLDDARAALEDGGYALCLELLTQATGMAPMADRAAEIVALRHAAETGLAREEATRRARHEADQARERWAQARHAAETHAPPDYAPTLWAEAEAKAAEGHAALAREAYAEARQAFANAAAVYPRFADAARAAQLQEREAADQARAQLAQWRAQAQTAGAPHYAPDLWDTAETKATEAPAALATSRGRDLAGFHDAIALYRRAHDAAHEARARERQRAHEARDQMTRSRQDAASVAAEHLAPARWSEAAAKAAEAEAALAADHYAQAVDTFDAARGLYRDADTQAREVRRAQRQQAEQKRQEALALRATALAGTAASLAPAEWQDAETALAAGDAALAQDSALDAAAAFDHSAACYRHAETRARDIAHARADADQARERWAQARHAAETHAPPDYAPTLWAEAEASAAEGHAALAREAYAEARQAFANAAAVYPRFADAARAAQLQEREAADQARAQLAQWRAQAQTAGAPHYAPDLWDAAETKATEAPAALTTSRGRDLAGFHDAIALFRRAHDAAHQARARERQRAHEARDQMTRSRQDAASVAAEHLAPARWSEAVAKAAEAEAALAADHYAQAVDAFDAARGLYRDADTQAREVRRAQRQQAEQKRQETLARRDSARAGDAPTLAPAEWQDAETALAAGDAALAQDSALDAAAAFDHSAACYRHAETRARDIAHARADADQAREAAARARRAAVEAKAPKYAPDALQAAENAQTRAGEAFARQDYPDARLLFAEARRLFAGATQTAGAAAEAEARLVEAMLGDARRLLDSLEVTACLRRLHEVLRLRPGHEAAERLRQDAEARRRQLETKRDAEATAPPAESPAQDATILTPGPVDAGSTPTVIGTPPFVAGPMTVATASPAVDERTPPIAGEKPGPGKLLVPVEPPSGPGDASTVVWRSPPAHPVAETTEATVYAPSPHAPSPSPGVSRTSSPSTPPREADRPRRTPKAAALAIGGLVAAGVVAFYAMPRTPPPAPGPALQARPAPQATPAPAPVKPVEPPPAPEAKDDSREKAPTAGQDPTAAPREPDVRPPATRDAALAKRESEIRAAADRVAEARQEAEQASAPRLARGPWMAAEAAQRKAEAALKQQAFDRAETLFAEAEQKYRAAEKTASDSATASAAERARIATIERNRPDAEQARRTAAQARQDAEHAGAPRLAATTFGGAQQKEKEGEVSFDRKDFASAQGRFQEAQHAYGQAAQEARRAGAADAQRVAVLQRQQSEAEQARERMAVAKRAAEQGGGPRHAPRLLASAQAKEGEAGAALGRSDYAGAARLFNDARGEYEAAAQESRRRQDAEEQQMAALRSSVNQSRSRALSRRDDAVKAGADRLAKDLFDAAQSKLGEADGLAGQQNLADATHTYQAAADRYAEAGQRARVIGEAKGLADQARAHMASERQRARQDAPEFGAAAAHERQGAQHYQRASFKEARESFAAAAELFAKAATRPADPPRPAPADEIREVLASYARAFEAKDVGLVQRIRPGLNPDEVRRLRDSFAQSKEYRLTLKLDSVDVKGDQAIVKGHREDTVVSKAGQSFRHQSGFVFHLRRAGDRWIIEGTD